MVLLESVVGIADRTKHLILQVLLPADIVDHLVATERIHEQSVDRKIPPLGVFLGVGEDDALGPAAVTVFQVCAEGCDLNDARAMANEDYAEGGADGLRVGEELTDAMRRGVGGDVEVLGCQPQQHVAHAPAGEIGDVYGVAQATQPAAGLKDGDVLAICGDSITEQKLYSLYIEDYLLVCRPRQNLRAMQFGWGGEVVGGFLGRMSNVLRFPVTAATTCYGMN